MIERVTSSAPIMNVFRGGSGNWPNSVDLMSCRPSRGTDSSVPEVSLKPKAPAVAEKSWLPIVW
jgi:hypothetical protein